MVTINHTSTDLLLVEDDMHLRNRLKEAFEDRGFNCLVAESVAQGMSLLRERRPGKMVTDLKLRDGSGLELVKTATELGNTTETVVLSGYGTIATAVEAMKLGARNFVTKPANADSILDAFEGPLGEQNKPRDSRAKTSAPSTPSLDQVAWEHLSRVLTEHRGNVSQAAEALGMHRRTLQRKLAKYPGTLK